MCFKLLCLLGLKLFLSVFYCFSTPLLETGGKAWLKPRRLRPARRLMRCTPPHWAAFIELAFLSLLKSHALLAQAVSKIRKSRYLLCQHIHGPLSVLRKTVFVRLTQKASHIRVLTCVPNQLEN